MNLRVWPDDAREHVVVQLEMDGKPLGWINLDVAAAHHHLEAVGAARAKLTDEVAATLDTGSRITATFDPTWRTDPGPVPETVSVVLRHPGLGWLGFLLPAQEARALGDSLVALAGPSEPKA